MHKIATRIHLDEDLHQWVKQEAEDQRCSMSHIIRKLLMDAVRRKLLMDAVEEQQEKVDASKSR